MLEKLLCPQCGGNDLKIFGESAFKCEACGTILQNSEKEKPNISSHYVAPVTSEFLNSEERYGDDYLNENNDEISSGDSFIKTLVIGAVIVLFVMLAVYLLT